MGVADLFSDQVKSGPSFAAFCIQQLAVPLSAFVGMVLVPNPFSWPALETVTLSSRIGAVMVYAAAAAIAGAAAAVAVRSIFGIPAAGKWVWIIPSSLGILGLVWDSTQFSFKYALSDLFLPGPEGEEWWAFLLFTCPAIACVAY